MAYAIVHHFPGGTKAQYEASIQAIHPAHGGLPEGQISHMAGASDGGWTITAVHDSLESWVRFRDNTLVPTMQKGIAGGFTTPPTEIAFEVANKQVPTVVVTHEVDDVARWVASNKRDEVFGSIGITVRTFVDPAGGNRVGLVAQVPDMDAMQAMIQSAAGAEAMKHDGVRPETIAIFTAP